MLIGRADLALAAMDDRARDRAPDLSPQQDRRTPRPDRRAPPPPPGRSGEAHRTDSGKRLAQPAIGFEDQERKPEHARPGLPFRNDVSAVMGAVERKRQAGIAMLEHEHHRALIVVRRR